ncbi:MAG: S8 family serine peptidase [Chloroflexi bacterium]|nr:S8 family serine peptidase [Chloroflexota bacterium]OJV96820.1 MAG: hypothetical protein BGO39_08945 [Chloroflexi bacterium 54-19]
MAKGRATQASKVSQRPAPRTLRPSALTLSISLSLLLIAPLCWNLLSSDGNGLFTSANQTGKVYRLPETDYDPNPAPIPGELLIRVEEPIAPILQNELAKSLQTLPFGQNEVPLSALIGQRLSGEQFGESWPAAGSLVQKYGLWAADAIDPELGTWRLKLNPQSDLTEAVADFQELNLVRYVEPDYPVYGLSLEPNDPYFAQNQQPALRTIHAPEAWDISTGSSNVAIAFLDTGLAYGHNDLKDKIMTDRGRNFVAEPANDFAWDDNGHGTYVAGIAAAQTNNGLGIAGVSWGSRLLSVKVLDYANLGSIATFSMGLAYTTTQPVQVVNMSTGSAVRSRIMEDEVEKAFNKGLVLIAASGNEGKLKFTYPAAFDNVIAVGALDSQGKPAAFSTYGQYLSLVAPGENILSLNWASDRDYALGSGTSSACPFVSGTVALMLSVNPNLSNRQIRNILEGTAVPVPGVAVPTSTPTPIPEINPTIAPTPTSGSLVTPTPLTPVAGLQADSTTGATGSAGSSNYNFKMGWGRLDVFGAVLAARDNVYYPGHHTTLTGMVEGFPDALDVTVSLEPGDVRFPDETGRYQFTNLPPGSYRLVVESKKYNIKTTDDLVIEGSDANILVQNFDFTAQVASILDDKTKPAIGAFLPVTKPNDPEVRYFPNKHTLAGAFKDYWVAKGGLPIFGMPISEEFQENGLTVQYFERAILEYHTEFASTRQEIQPRLVGTAAAKNLADQPAFKRLADTGKIPTVPATAEYFDTTGHSLDGIFKTFWESNGGLALFGYPISEPFKVTDADGKARLTQYFERCRMDYFPEQEGTPYVIQLGLLGRESALQQGLISTP